MKLIIANYSSTGITSIRLVFKTKQMIKFGKDKWIFYGRHDPEGYPHLVSDLPIELVLHPVSPAYRLILNTIYISGRKKN